MFHFIDIFIYSTYIITGACSLFYCRYCCSPTRIIHMSSFYRGM